MINIRISTYLDNRLHRGEAGATAVEYALLIAFIATIIIGAVLLLGSRLAVVYDTFRDGF